MVLFFFLVNVFHALCFCERREPSGWHIQKGMTAREEGCYRLGEFSNVRDVTCTRVECDFGWLSCLMSIMRGENWVISILQFQLFCRFTRFLRNAVCCRRVLRCKTISSKGEMRHDDVDDDDCVHIN